MNSMYNRREEPYALPPAPEDPSSAAMRASQHPHLQQQHMQHHYGQHPPHPQMPQHQQLPQHPQQQLPPQHMPVSTQSESGQDSEQPKPLPPHLQPVSTTKDGKTYTLLVEQHPIRARMCGFGDKDRRPITPPPCIRLIITNATTGEEIPVDDIDSTFFVLTVDLWNVDGNSEVNLVRSSQGAPSVSISTSTTTSYPPPIERPQIFALPASIAPGYRDPYGAPAPMHGHYAMQQQQMQPGYYPPAPAAPAAAGGFPGYNLPPGAPQYPMPMPIAPAQQQQQASGLFTRNLIGSLTVNAFKLHDHHGKTGFWFVLQDLSVRTEGNFRLKMSFVDVGMGNGQLNSGRAPVLATCFTDYFQVYSAKKFPGVIESTSLSKVFAQQGIKIPIRKDGPKAVPNQEEFDNEEA